MNDKTIKTLIISGFFVSAFSLFGAYLLDLGIFTAFQWVVIPVAFITFLLIIRIKDPRLLKQLKRSYYAFYGTLSFLYVLVIIIVIIIFGTSV